MSIIHIVRQFYPLVGGLENYVYNLAREQAKMGLKVKVVTLNRSFIDDQILPTKEMYNDIEIIRIPFWGSTRYPFAFSVLKHCKNCDIIHVHAVDFFADFISFTKQFHKQKLVLTTHGGFFHTQKNSKLKQLFFKTITKLSLKNYNHIIACSSNDYNMFSQISGNVKLVPNGVDVSKYINVPKKVEKGTLITVGRIDIHKGVDKLIKIIGKFRERGIRLKLEVVGPDSRNLMPGLKQLAHKLSVSDRVIFKGKLNDADLLEAYSRAHFFVSASNYEGFGIVAVEALASGTPCILNDIPSFKEIIAENEIGEITDFNNTDEVVMLIEKMIFMNDSKYFVLSENAREHAQRFNWKQTAKQIEEIYSIA